MLKKCLVLLFILLTGLACAETKVDNTTISSPQWPELILDTEYAVTNMPDGNLSGIALCNGELLAVSDRSDSQYYKLIKPSIEIKQKKTIQLLVAEPILFQAPAVPKEAIPIWSSLANVGIGIVRGGIHDFEGITCDKEDNHYLVSEAYLAVLKIPTKGQPEWLNLPNDLWEQAKTQGLLQKTNQMLEGIAISPDSKKLWLAAERNKRGLLVVEFEVTKGWYCPNNRCVLLAESGKEPFPKQFRRKNRVDVRDFSDLAFYKHKLFTLERGTFRICRRDLNGKLEQCWSIAGEALQPQRQYKVYGMPEALAIDEQGAWVGIDNDLGNKRIDGENRPIVWYFKAPAKGWLAAEGTVND